MAASTRGSRFSVWVVSSLLALPALGNGRQRCELARGKLQTTALPAPPCTSPIGLCTTGRLSGSLSARFDFRALNMSPVDPSRPFLQQYSGEVTLTLDDGGEIFADNVGVIDTDPAGEGDVFDFSTIVGGTGRYENATGTMIISGNFSFATGTGESDYVALLCTR